MWRKLYLDFRSRQIRILCIINERSSYSSPREPQISPTYMVNDLVWTSGCTRHLFSTLLFMQFVPIKQNRYGHYHFSLQLAKSYRIHFLLIPQKIPEEPLHLFGFPLRHFVSRGYVNTHPSVSTLRGSWMALLSRANASPEVQVYYSLATFACSSFFIILMHKICQLDMALLW
jgi:hypothetical protein